MRGSIVLLACDPAGIPIISASVTIGRSGKLNFLVGLDSRNRLVVQLRPRCDALPAAWCSPVSQKRVHRPTPSAVPSVTTAIPWRVRASWKTNPMIAISCAGCRHCTRRTRQIHRRTSTGDFGELTGADIQGQAVPFGLHHY